MTPEQTKQLFALVDVLIKFSSDETGLPIKSAVKRQLTSRDAVEKYLEEKFNDDQGTKRLQRDEIVLKKFGLYGLLRVALPLMPQAAHHWTNLLLFLLGCDVLVNYRVIMIRPLGVAPAPTPPAPAPAAVST